MDIKLTAKKEDREIISAIAVRANAEMGQLDKITVEMDITATHLNGCPLDLKKLLCASKLVLLHDVLGINKHINPETGALEDCFLPRCAAPRKK